MSWGSCGFFFGNDARGWGLVGACDCDGVFTAVVVVKEDGEGSVVGGGVLLLVRLGLIKLIQHMYI